MTHFQIKINPNDDASSDILIVDNFHPRWKEAFQSLPQENLEKIMGEYSERILKWTRVPASLEFDPKYGLTHIHLPIRGGLDLFDYDFSDPSYRSHNLHAPEEIITATAIITHYIGWLNFGLKQIGAEE